MDDVWEMFRLIVAERKKREVDPTLEILKESLRLSLEDGGPPEAADKLGRMLEFFESLDAFYERADHLSTSSLKSIMKAGDVLGTRFLGAHDEDSRQA